MAKKTPAVNVPPPRSALVNMDVTRRDFASVEFSSPDSLLGYDLVVVDVEEAFRTYASLASQYKGLPSLSEAKSKSIISDCERRKREFRALLDRGGILILLVPPPLVCYIDTGQRQTSGTGRNQKVTHLVAEFQFLRMCLPEQIDLRLARGSAITLGDHPVAHLLRGIEGLLYHEAVIESNGYSPIAFIANTRHPVAASKRTNNGVMLLLPRTVAAEKYETQAAWLKDYALYLDAFHKTKTLLSPTPALHALPDWAKQLHTRSGREQLKKIAGASTEAAEAQARLRTAEQELEEIEQRKLLLTATGAVLEHAVAAVLRRLGFEVTEPGDSRSDLLIKFREARAVAEIKGLTGAAKETNASQVEKWVATYHAEHGIEPKGILIVNAFRDTPLLERPNDAFPKQMMPYVNRKEISLVTTTQLFLADAALAADPKRVEAFRNAILTTTGLVPDFVDPAEFLQVGDSVENKKVV